MITNKGKVLWANALGDLRNGYADTLKETTGTTLVPKANPKWSAEQFTGQDVYAGGFVGTVLSNTEKLLTVDRWSKLPSEEHPTWNRSEESTAPVGGAAYYIVSGATPAAWVAVSANTAEPKATNETLAGEIKTAEGGLVRALSKFTYLGTNKYKVEVTFTANVHDTVPVTLAKIGIFNASKEGVLMFESLLTATAEIKESGDSVTITDTVSGS